MNIHFEYGFIFDQEISNITGLPQDPQLVSQMELWTPLVNERWKNEGQPLLKKACEISGLQFKQSEAKCILTLSDFVSMSHPFIVNVKKYVANNNLDFLTEVIFHEALHILLTDNCKVWPTQLTHQFSEQNPTVAAHLHLMALERMTHLAFKHHKRIDQIAGWYNTIGDGYDLAWQSIANDETCQALINEFRDESQWGKTL